MFHKVCRPCTQWKIVHSTGPYLSAMASRHCILVFFAVQFHPGPGASVGKDYTLYALSSGIVDFHMTKYKRVVRFQWSHVIAATCLCVCVYGGRGRQFASWYQNRTVLPVRIFATRFCNQ